MHIEKIKLENFKAFKCIEFNCNETFNVIVGENNIGKSTLFEALNLWKFAYNTLIQESNRKKFYKASTNYYIPFSSLSQVRLVNDSDLFYDPKKKIEITLTIKDGEHSFSLKIKFEKPGIKNSYLRLFNHDDYEQFDNFAKHIESKTCSLKNAVFIYQTRPISTIYRNEPFYNNAQIEKKISIGKSHDVLRNKILKTEDSQAKVAQKFSRLEERLERVLNNKYSIRSKNKSKSDEEYVRITVEFSTGSVSRKELEISMMGSGFLQVMEIFSTIEYIEKQSDGICLILIDEPDAHIHSDLQSRLIDELKNHSDSQIFIITHNDRLISKIDGGELFYLNSTVKDLGLLKPLEIEDFQKVKEGLASVLSELEKSDGVPLILTEGKTDQKILTVAWNKLYNNSSMPYKIVSSGIQIDEENRTGSADSVRRSLEYISTLSERTIIGIFDNDREGNGCFKGLNQSIFESYDINQNIRKHQTKNIYGILLPVPEDREKFVTITSLTQRYLVIEHYFSDTVLENYNLKGESILNTDVFEIKGNKNHKNTFASECNNLSPNDFKSFIPLFDTLSDLVQDNI